MRALQLSVKGREDYRYQNVVQIEDQRVTYDEWNVENALAEHVKKPVSMKLNYKNDDSLKNTALRKK